MFWERGAIGMFIAFNIGALIDSRINFWWYILL